MISEFLPLTKSLSYRGPKPSSEHAGITCLDTINVGTTVNCAVNEVGKPLTAIHALYCKWLHFVQHVALLHTKSTCNVYFMSPELLL